jgi:hypothetical protein
VVWLLALALSLSIAALVGTLDLKLYGILRKTVDRTPPKAKMILALAFSLTFVLAGTVWALKYG